EFGFRSLLPSRAQQHHQIGMCDSAVGRGDFQSRRHDSLNEQQPAATWHCMTAIAENERSPLVVPIVDNVLEDVEVRVRWYCLEKIAGHKIAAVCDACPLQEIPRTFDGMGSVK